jgi:hypothetical protein
VKLKSTPFVKRTPPSDRYVVEIFLSSRYSNSSALGFAACGEVIHEFGDAENCCAALESPV